MKTKILLIYLVAILFFLPLVLGQEPEKPKFGAFGLSVNTESDKSLAGWGAIGLGLTQDLVSFTDFDVAVVKGITLEQALKNEGLQYTARTGFAYKLPIGLPKWMSVWALGDAGIAAGGPDGATGQTVVSGSYAGGGFIHIGSEKVGGLLILQVDKNATTGVQFIPRVGVKIKI